VRGWRLDEQDGDTGSGDLHFVRNSGRPSCVPLPSYTDLLAEIICRSAVLTTYCFPEERNQHRAARRKEIGKCKRFIGRPIDFAEQGKTPGLRIPFTVQGGMNAERGGRARAEQWDRGRGRGQKGCA